MRIGITFDVKLASAGQLAGLAADEEEEFDSPATIMALHAVLQELGHEVLLLGNGEDMLRQLLQGERPELVLNIAEGRGTSRSREARVPAVLEMLGIPYTGSDPLTLAVTLDKDCAKRLVRDAGLPTPPWVLVSGELTADIQRRLDRLEMPVFVKPAYEGSSKGILASNLIHDRAELTSMLERLCETYHQPVLVEEFIDGDELTVGVLGNAPPEVVGIMRVLPRQADGPFVYSLEVKRDWERRVRYECPAQLSPADSEAVSQAALACYRTLGCRDVSRLDFRLRNHVPYFLEVNPLPGLSPTSGDLVLLSGFMGVEYRELIGRILEAALGRLENRLPVGIGAGHGAGCPVS